MEKFFKKFIVFLFIIVLADVTFGVVCRYMHDNVQGGGMAKRLYVADDSRDQIMMFGSSRMNHHYNPMIVSDSLSMTCYNAGQDGCGILMSYGFLTMMLDRYSPDLIVYDLSEFDFQVDDNMKHISLLKPYYDRPSIKEIITDVSPNERIKMCSSFYRYNSIFIRILGGFISSSSEYQKGYIPLMVTMDYDVETPVGYDPDIDPVKIRYLKKFIELCKEREIPLVFCISPRYKAESSRHFNAVKELCSEEGILLLDYYSDPYFSFERDLFQDQVHLNSKGADAYTKEIIPYFEQILSEPSC